MAEAVPVDMLEDIQTAVTFLCRILINNKKISTEQIHHFGECLIRVLSQRYTGHWYPEKPMKGQAYRCIRINRNSPVDESLLKACEEAGLQYSELQLPVEFTLWIDPRDVSCRLDESGDPFQVGEEYRSGKSSPELQTSDYHSASPELQTSDDPSASPELQTSDDPSASPSECGLEDEAQTQNRMQERPQGGMMAPQKKRPWWSRTTQSPGLWLPSPVWVPCDPSMLTYIHYHLSAVLFYRNAPWRSPARRRPDPNLTKRLTKRACRK